eukprot:TRINITY_DN5650_c0_g1_i2.p1 TRINITY_DN5650_c0_g1~~TRINITY_DN5650_c0_g1_i2.p1  ORF type:complete len:130 (+),score=21.38 TRINITY_DN5650_c0_g1_i2:160-549(+)
MMNLNSNLKKSGNNPNKKVSQSNLKSWLTPKLLQDREKVLSNVNSVKNADSTSASMTKIITSVESCVLKDVVDKGQPNPLLNAQSNIEEDLEVVGGSGQRILAEQPSVVADNIPAKSTQSPSKWVRVRG